MYSFCIYLLSLCLFVYSIKPFVSYLLREEPFKWRSKIGFVSLKTESFKCFPPSPKGPKGICSCARSQEIRRCVWFLGVIFIMLDDIIDAVCSVKGNHNKCGGFSITTPYSTVNNSMTQCRVDLVWSSCIADLRMRSHSDSYKQPLQSDDQYRVVLKRAHCTTIWNRSWRSVCQEGASFGRLKANAKLEGQCEKNTLHRLNESHGFNYCEVIHLVWSSIVLSIKQIGFVYDRHALPIGWESRIVQNPQGKHHIFLTLKGENISHFECITVWFASFCLNSCCCFFNVSDTVHDQWCKRDM